MRDISNTQVTMWQRCPRQYEFRYVRGIKIPPKGVMIQGSAYHGALKANFESKIKTKEDLNSGDLLDAYDTSWNDRVTGDAIADDGEVIPGFAGIDWEQKDPGKLKDEGAVLLSLYHRQMASSVIPINVEKKSGERIDADVRFIGFPDVETENEIIDHKLRSASLSQDMADRDFQPFSYLWLRKKRLFVYHVAVKKKIPEIQVVKVQKTVQDINWWIDAVRQVAAQIRTGIAPPRSDGWHCSERFCGYWKLCRGKV